MGADPDAQQVPSVLVVLFATPLWYVNAAHFQTELRAVLAAAQPKPTVVVLDSIGMNDIDFTGCRVLAEVLDELAHEHITFAMARAGTHLHESLKREGLYERIGANHFFDSVDEAVVALSDDTTPPVSAS
jgi:MFS superfamily sulfate permease-like transporter